MWLLLIRTPVLDSKDLGPSRELRWQMIILSFFSMKHGYGENGMAPSNSRIRKLVLLWCYRKYSYKSIPVFSNRLRIRTDYLLTQDKSFKKWAKAYAENQNLWFEQYGFFLCCNSRRLTCVSVFPTPSPAFSSLECLSTNSLHQNPGTWRLRTNREFNVAFECAILDPQST